MMHLVRHASAGVRGSYGNDDARPLDARGLEQAAAIAGRLFDTGVQRILSSRSLRCVQTVEPLAAKVGLEIEIHDALYEGGRGDATHALLLELAADGTAAVLCSHGDIIPDVLRRLERHGVPLDGSACPKGSIWTLEVDDSAIVAARYVGAPR